MDHFPHGTQAVRLKNRLREAYLAADEDGVGVSLSPHGGAPSTAWEVRQESNLWDLHFTCLLLRSAASGRFLSLAPDHRGRRVRQRVYEEGDHPGAFMWRAIRKEDGSGESVILLHVLGLAVRADDGSFNGVAADDLDMNCEAMLWTVEVEAAPLPPAVPDPQLLQEVGDDGAPEAVLDGADDVQQAAAEGAADGNGGLILPAGDVAGVAADQRDVARLYGKLENVYHLMERQSEMALQHHRRIQNIQDEAKALGDWSQVRDDRLPHDQALTKIERSYELRVKLASSLRLEIVRLGFPPLEEPDGLRHPNHLRR